jgi:hypothetical protein
VYSSLNKVDLVVEGGLAVQTDHREPDEILGSWDVSVVLAAARALNPVRYAVAERVRFAHLAEPPARLRELYAALGAETEVREEVAPPQPDEARADQLVREALGTLADRVLREWGVTSAATGLERLETAYAARVGAIGDDDEIERWTAVVELGAAVGALILREVPGARWGRDPRQLSPIPYLVEREGHLTNVFGKVERYFREGPSESPSHLFRMLKDDGLQDGPLMLNLRPRDWSGKDDALLIHGLLPEADGAEVPLIALICRTRSGRCRRTPRTSRR